jgi:outer membrane protein TolC
MSAASLIAPVEEHKGNPPLRTLRSLRSTRGLTCILCVQAFVVWAQSREPRGQTLQLATLQQQALDADPRTRELQLYESQTALRLRTLDAERLPSVTLLGQAQYQSDVPTAPFTLDGRPIFAPPKDTYDASFRVDQRLFDPTRDPRLAVEQAQLAESQARVRATLFGVRQQVNDAFFAAALLQEQLKELGATLADLDARLRETTARVREGAALPGDTAAVEATLLERRQDDARLRANRRAALARLGSLTGRAVTEDDELALPQLETAVVEARRSLDSLRARPEYEQFERTRDRLARQQQTAGAMERPQIGAFARAGYGKPGLNFISDRFESYGLAGIQIQWKAWTWGAANREREVLAIQQQIVDADQAAFTKSIREAILSDLATIDRLQETLALDDRIITLRVEVDRSTKARFDERVVTASEYLDRNTELLQARYARTGHQAELAQASARFLTTLGLEVK